MLKPLKIVLEPIMERRRQEMCRQTYEQQCDEYQLANPVHTFFLKIRCKYNKNNKISSDFPVKRPQDYSDGNGNVQRMLGAVLRYFQCEIGSVHYLLRHS